MKKISSIAVIRTCTASCLFLAANAGISVFYGTATAQLVPRASGTNSTDAARPSYSDLADLGTIAPVVVVGEISSVIPLKPAQSVGVAPGYRRSFMTAKVVGLIRGEGGVAPNLTYLYDIPVDSRGKIPKLKKQRVLLFARAGTRPGEIQLAAPDAQIRWTVEDEATVRRIVAEVLSAKSPPKITGLGDAFHVAGTVQGEGETQIFLKTDSGEPVSLSIVRRPEEQPRWAVALGEIVDEAAATPKPGTLLWYRLACGLPPSLPAAAVRTLALPDAEAARADYQIVIDGLGPCERTRKAR